MAAPTGRLSRFIPEKLLDKFGNVSGNLKIEFPERFKGTVVEKWANYWKNMLNDYKDVAKDTVKDIYARPARSACIASALGAALYCASTNPDEINFRDRLLFTVNEMTLVPAAILNPKAADHIAFLETCYNQGVVRRFNIGLASFMWVDNYDTALGYYAAQCSYLKPGYLKFHKRIIDVGFLGHWWILEKVMFDFDINPSEWKDVHEER